MQTFSDFFYLDVRLPNDSKLSFPAAAETAAYVVNGRVQIDEQSVECYSMAVIRKCHSLNLHAAEESRVMLLAKGTPM